MFEIHCGRGMVDMPFVAAPHHQTLLGRNHCCKAFLLLSIGTNVLTFTMLLSKMYGVKRHRIEDFARIATHVC